MMNKELHSDLPIPPGEFLEEVLEDLGMSKDELARRMDRPAAKLSAIFSGDKAITPETALQLEKVTAVPAHIWTGLESEYRLILARIHAKSELENKKIESPLITRYCYKELVRLGYVEKKTKPSDKVDELQKYLCVTSLNNTVNIKRYHPFFKQNINKHNKISSEALISWIRMGEIEAQKFQTKSFDPGKLYNLIPDLRQMTLKPLDNFQKKFGEKFSDAGVALVVVPHFPKTYAHGASFWLNKNKAVLMITIRGRWADMFWFSLIHELGHILLHNKQQIFVESDDISFVNQKLEDEADKFAADILIPSAEFKSFVNKNIINKKDIIEFAGKIYIHPGIVVGRLHHDNIIPQAWFNDLRERY